MTATLPAQEAVVAAMRTAAPPGLGQLGQVRLDALQKLTRQLAAARPGAASEYQRFLRIRERSLRLPHAELRERLAGETVLVTGGTGCIGTQLLILLADCQPGHLVSVSRGVTQGLQVPGVLYRSCDVADYPALEEIVRGEAPGVIFHVAAQRSPALAETGVHRTVRTNTLGACNVLSAAVAAGVPQVVMASTGKAVRPYSPEVYTASKRAAEQAAAATVAGTGLLCSASRFTHVVDNSIFHQLLLRWTAQEEPVRLHDPDILFYLQSARESAQLLLLAMLGAVPGEFRVNAITNLGWPVSLLDLALGAVEGTRSPLYFSGYDPGYEETPFPGLYDLRTAGDVSPLLNAFEAPLAVRSPDGATDAFPVRAGFTQLACDRFSSLALTCAQTTDPGAVRQALDELSWTLLAGTVAAADPAALARSAALACQYEHVMSPVHQRVLDVIRKTGA